MPWEGSPFPRACASDRLRSGNRREPVSLSATAAAALREQYTFAGPSAICAAIAGWTIPPTRVFNGPTALWLTFAGGIALLVMAMRALAAHEMTIEHFHRLAVASANNTSSVLGRNVEAARSVRSWLYWLSETAVGLAGAFVMATTYVWPHKAVAAVSPRWLAFSVAAIATTIELLALTERALVVWRGGATTQRLRKLVATGIAGAIAGALLVTVVTVAAPDNVPVDGVWAQRAYGGSIAAGPQRPRAQVRAHPP